MTPVVNTYDCRSRDHLEVQSEIPVNAHPSALWNALTTSQHLLGFNPFIISHENGEVYGIGIGRSKKLAEQEAARRAWKKVYDRRTASGGGNKRANADKPQESSGEGRRSRGSGSSRRRRPSKPKASSSSSPASTSDKAAPKEGSKPRSGRSRSRRSGGNKSSDASNSTKA